MAVAPGVKIEVWSDVVCPWCFIGKRRLEGALAEFEHRDDVEVIYRSFELDPTAPAGEFQPIEPALARKFGTDVEQVHAMQQQVATTAAAEGLAFSEGQLHSNSFTAHRILHYALETGGPALQNRLKEALLSAHFEQAQEVSDPEVLVRVATQAGLDAAAVREVIASDAYAEAVRADVNQARELGANGVPFFVIDRKYGVSGAQPKAVFTQVLERAWEDSAPKLEQVGTEADACGPDGCAL